MSAIFSRRELLRPPPTSPTCTVFFGGGRRCNHLGVQENTYPHLYRVNLLHFLCLQQLCEPDAKFAIFAVPYQSFVIFYCFFFFALLPISMVGVFRSFFGLCKPVLRGVGPFRNVRGRCSLRVRRAGAVADTHQENTAEQLRRLWGGVAFACDHNSIVILVTKPH